MSVQSVCEAASAGERNGNKHVDDVHHEAGSQLELIYSTLENRSFSSKSRW
jgi:hypothetical protein